MSFLARLSLANRGLVALIAVVITGFGVFAVPSLKQQLLPSLELPAAFIGAALPGAGPEIIEDQITKPIEDAVKGVDGLDSVTSTTREGSASIRSPSRSAPTSTLRSTSCTPRSTGSSRSCPTTSTRPSSPAAPTTSRRSCSPRPAAATRATCPPSCNDTVVPELQRDRGRPRHRSHRRPRRADRDHARPGQVHRGRHRPARASPRVLQANGVSIPAGAVVDGDDPDRAGRHPDHLGRPAQGIFLTGAAGPVKLGDVAAVAEQAAGRRRRTPVPTAWTASASRSPPRPTATRSTISHEVRDQLADLADGLRRQADRHHRPGAVRRAVDREPDHRGPARPA